MTQWGLFDDTTNSPSTTSVDRKSFTDFFDKTLFLQEGENGFRALAAPLDALAARLFMIDHAQVRLDLQTYLFHDDVTGALVVKHLIDAAQRGVKVRVLLDDYDAAPKDRYLLMIAQHPNIEVRLFNPNYFRNTLRTFALLFRLNRLGRRMHNKALVADSQVALVGGRNIGDVYFALDDERLFLDFDLLGIGEIAGAVQQQFEDYWQSPLTKSIRKLVKYRLRFEAYEKIYQRSDDRLSQFYQSSTAKRLTECDFVQLVQQNKIPMQPAEAALFYDTPEKVNLNAQAQDNVGLALWRYLQLSRELILVTPYFIPTEKGIAFFQQLKQKDVRIIIVTNSLASTDVLVAYSGYLHYYTQLLEMGIELYEIRGQVYKKWRWHKKYWRQNLISLHTKLVLIDDTQLLTGSANFDPRSNRLNTEMMVAIQQPEMVAQQKAQLLSVLKGENVFKLGLESRTKSSSIYWQTYQNGEQKRYFQPPRLEFCVD